MILSDDDKLLIRKAEDKFISADKNYMITNTGFLSERELGILLTQDFISESIKHVFYGGFDGAERQMLIFYPEYFDFTEDNPVTALRASYYKDYTLSHRDFLGAILALGITRDCLGDILVDNDAHTADIIIKKDILKFLLSELKQSGRASLTLKEISLSSLHIPKDDFIFVKDTVASPRLDAVTSSGFGISRENANKMIKSGKVFVNRIICDSPDKLINDGAVISSHGFGKFIVTIPGNTSKKGRIFLEIKKFK